ncbi:disease resistance protein Roq1-like [Bidens hawaiensis]|uniref:disease resistance protein Roq1-like n=1 Tax=Bidens hawaiensis TaxID=980011 RepID=UPI004049FB77
MGGIGKTLLAKHVFQLHSSKFYKSNFIEGINTRCIESFVGVLDLQKQLHGVNGVSKKVFMVLDDIGSINQLDALLENKSLHPGSKIVITTKDASLTERCALFKSQPHPYHREVLLDGLNEYESLELLCVHAFESRKPKESYREVSEKLVKYCDGHPLALEVLGKLLHKRDVAYWEECLKGLKKEPHSSIKKVFRISFDSLSSNEMELFKHIACFFVGKDRDFTQKILKACDLETRSGITNFIDKCLLSVDGNNKYLMMHSLIQDMGRDLVRQESLKKPWKRSRLWCHEESFKVLKQEKGKGNLLGLSLDVRMFDKKKLRGSFEVKTKSLSKMDNLMLLQFNYVQMNGSYEDFPEELRWLCMQGFSLKSIPLDLPMENLVALDIVGGFLEIPALERLILRKCKSLIGVCESIEQCVELAHIDLSYCYQLKKVPISIAKLKKVKTLLVDGCSSHESQIKTIPSDLKLFSFSLPSSLRILSLANNNMSNESFPSDFSSLSMLQELCLDNNPIVSMPDCMRSLPRLEILYMNYCRMVISIENPPPRLSELSIDSFYRKTSLRKIKFDPEMFPLRLRGAWGVVPPSSFEIDGVVKIQDMAGVEEKVLHSLAWSDLEFIRERRLRTRTGGPSVECQTQMYYEFGIFSTFYLGNEMANWIEYRSEGPSISFTIPSSTNKLRGLNFCCVGTSHLCAYEYVKMPWIEISNNTKNYTWIYDHYIGEVKLGGECLVLLSHWMFGPNEMKCGDFITITVTHVPHLGTNKPLTRECGVSVVYDEDGKIEEEEEDALGYYKSWNHIIGGDLSPFQLKSGEYLLHRSGFLASDGISPAFIKNSLLFEDTEVNFRAFSPSKSEKARQAMAAAVVAWWSGGGGGCENGRDDDGGGTWWRSCGGGGAALMVEVVVVVTTVAVIRW